MLADEYRRLIGELDQVLAAAHGFVRTAKSPADEAAWWVRIDRLLDERLRLMGARDAAETLPGKAA